MAKISLTFSKKKKISMPFFDTFEVAIEARDNPHITYLT